MGAAEEILKRIATINAPVGCNRTQAGAAVTLAVRDVNSIDTGI